MVCIPFCFSLCGILQPGGRASSVFWVDFSCLAARFCYCSFLALFPVFSLVGIPWARVISCFGFAFVFLAAFIVMGGVNAWHDNNRSRAENECARLYILC